MKKFIYISMLAVVLGLMVSAARAQNTDEGGIEVGQTNRWSSNLILGGLYFQGCSADCEIDQISFAQFGPVDFSGVNTALQAGQVHPFNTQSPISGTISPRNVGDCGLRITITGGCSAHIHPHKTVTETITWHSQAPNISLHIINACMRDNYTFDVHLSRGFGNRTLPVRINAVVNGIPISVQANRVDNIGQTTGQGGLYTADPISFTFLNQIPRFTSDQSFEIDASIQVRDWVYHAPTRIAYIPLPTVIVPGALPSSFGRADAKGGNGAFPVLEHAMWSIAAASNGGVYDQDAHQFADARLIRVANQATPTRPFYPTMQTIDFHGQSVDRNTCTLADGGKLVATTIHAMLQNTWAGKVHLISHSKGGLLVRSALVQEPALAGSIGYCVMIETPHSGMPFPFYADVANSLYHHYFDNLLPVYPAYRPTPVNPFELWPSNSPELAELNRHRLPSGPGYVLAYSDTDSNTVWATTVVPLTKNLKGPGDGRVPVFSQLGQSWDANHPATPAKQLVPFRGVALHYMQVPGNSSSSSHGSTMTNKTFLDNLVSQIFD